MQVLSSPIDDGGLIRFERSTPDGPVVYFGRTSLAPDDPHTLLVDVFTSPTSDTPVARARFDAEVEIDTSEDEALEEWLLEALEEKETFLTHRILRLQARRNTGPLKMPSDVQPGDMVAFSEVLPGEWDLTFQYEDSTWAVHDSHCVNPKCTCTDAVLEFVAPSGTMLDGVRVDLETTAIREFTGEKDPDHPEIWQAFLAQRGTQVLKDRRLTLVEGLKPRPIRREPKVERNAPCPCGSGKKYKKCHGAA